VRWLEGLAEEDTASTVITIMEIRRGIETARPANPAVAAEVEEWLTGILDAGMPAILPLDTPAAQILGRLYALPALRSFFTTDPAARQAKTGADLAIAAIAISRQAAIATNNVSDFLAIHCHIALPGLFNPFTGDWHISPP
jgi:predicted nucleic acid-binding protein